MFYKWHRGHTQFFWDIKDQDIRQKKLNDLFVEHFGEIANGSFVEIGCHNGIDCGICTPLADLGWKGLCVDASRESAKLCHDNMLQNPNTAVVCCAVGSTEGETKLWGFGPGATTNEIYKQSVSDIPWTGNLNIGGRKIKQTTLNNLLREHKYKQNFELLSVDVEGNEPEVFEGFDLNFWAPKMMVIEMHDAHPDFKNKTEINERYTKLREHIISNSYKEVFADIVNTVFVLD